jgi:hypothetical protein
MAQPGTSDVHVDAIMTGHSHQLRNEAQSYVAGLAAPIIRVGKQSDKYFKYAPGNWFRDEAEKRAGSAESVGGGYELSTDTYYSEQFSFHKDVDGQTKANTDDPLDWRRDATDFVTDKLLLKRETAFAAAAMTTGVWTTDASVTNGWSDYGASRPLEDADTACETVHSKTGKMPNTLVLGYSAARHIVRHPNIVDLYKHTQRGVLTLDLVAQAMGLERILVMKAIKNSADEGAADSMGYVNQNSALFMHVAPNPGPRVASAMYNFAWTGLFREDGMEEDLVISSLDMPERNRTTRIEGDMCFDFKVIAADLGYFIDDVVS